MPEIYLFIVWLRQRNNSAKHTDNSRLPDTFTHRNTKKQMIARV